MRNNEETLKIKDKIETENTPEITTNLIKDILTSFREKAPGASGITRNLLTERPLEHPRNLRKDFYCLSSEGMLPDPLEAY